MAEWTTQQAALITAPEQVHVMTQSRDGAPRRPVIIWIVGDGDRVFIRSTNGRTAAWFRGALATGAGQIVAGGRTSEVRFTEADPSDLPAVDTAYRRKYGRYPSIVDHLVGDGPREATLQVRPA
jgi:hypothetical protein